MFNSVFCCLSPVVLSEPRRSPTEHRVFTASPWSACWQCQSRGDDCRGPLPPPPTPSILENDGSPGCVGPPTSVKVVRPPSDSGYSHSYRTTELRGWGENTRREDDGNPGWVVVLPVYPRAVLRKTAETWRGCLRLLRRTTELRGVCSRFLNHSRSFIVGTVSKKTTELRGVGVTDRVR